MACCICGNPDNGIILDYYHNKMKICNQCNQAKADLAGMNPQKGILYFQKILTGKILDKEVADVMTKLNPDFQLALSASLEKEQEKIEYAKSFQECYEYEVETLQNTGKVNVQEMREILNQYAAKGWKLHTIYSNELGENSVSLAGMGVNAVKCQDVLIFERRIPPVN